MAKATTAVSGDRSPRSGSSARPSPPTGPPTGSGSSEPRAGRRGRSDGRRTAWLFRFDRSFGCRWVAGADEAGRGSLAGPLVAAGVLLDYEHLDRDVRRTLAGLDDSKRKSRDEREDLYPAVLAAAVRVAVTARHPAGIDARGLHVTNLEALSDCLGRVARPGAKCLSDGFPLGSRCRVPHEAVVEGDGRSAAIAAASVVAKVTRDRYMERAGAEYPGWEFEGNVGYSTSEHRDSIARNGVSWLHRRSFASIAYTQLRIGA